MMAQQNSNLTGNCSGTGQVELDCWYNYCYNRTKETTCSRFNLYPPLDRIGGWVEIEESEVREDRVFPIKPAQWYTLKFGWKFNI